VNRATTTPKTITTEQSSTTTPIAKNWSTFWPLSPRAQLALCIALALALRLLILVRAHGMMEGDEAVLGVQAERILRGQLPIYFYGQAYMGSWDAYLMAPLVAIFGPSANVLHTVTLLESLLLIPLLGALAVRLYGPAARLPAMLLAAVAPLYVVVIELHALGGYIETLILGTALMLLVTIIAERWAAQRSTLWLWLLVGLLTGLAFWINPLIAYFLIACVLWMAPLALARIRRGWAEGAAWWRATALRIGGSLVTFCIGATPAIIYAFQNHLANVQFLDAGTGAGASNGFSLRLYPLQFMLVTALPHIMGVGVPWIPSSGTTHILVTAFAYIARIVVFVAIGYTLLLLIWRRPARGNRWLAAGANPLRQWWNYSFAPLLFFIVLLIYWRSSVVRDGPNQPATDRYLLPATIALSLMLTCLFVEWPVLFEWLARKLPQVRLPISSAVAERLPTLLMGALLALVVAGYGIAYPLANDVSAMGSAYAIWLTFPAEDHAMLGYLEQHQIHDVWTNHWIGHVIIYLEDERVACADYVSLTLKLDQPRFPEDTQKVAQADRASFIIYADPAHGEPLTEQELDQLHVAYMSARFGMLWVITPLSRTVHPQEIFTGLYADWGSIPTPSPSP
jgi:hypothetical protein